MLRSKAYEGRYRTIIEAYPFTPAMLAERDAWVVEQGARITGFYSLNVQAADLDLMFVDDGAQGYGLGRRLFEHMRQRAAAAALDRITIVAHPPAADFYRRMGAVDVGVSKAKSAQGWDRPVLSLEVAG